MSSSIAPEAGRRERLLEASGRLFTRWGYDKTSMDDIARETGISKGAVYLEYPNKEALFRGVLFREFSGYLADWLGRMEREGRDQWTFARMFQHSIAAMNANPFVKGLLTRDQQLFGAFIRKETGLITQIIAMRTELFGQLQQAGVVRTDIPAATLSYLMSAIGLGLVTCNDAIPVASQAPFEEALNALGLLLDRGLEPLEVKNRDAARDILIAMVEKMQAVLHIPFATSQ